MVHFKFVVLLVEDDEWQCLRHEFVIVKVEINLVAFW